MLHTLGIVVGAILMLLGLMGCFLPVLPGPPLSFIGLVLLAMIRHFSPPLTPLLILLMCMLTVAVVVLDHVLPILGARRYGSSKWAIYGSVVGMMAGAFFSPLGMLIGAFAGAVLAEWMASRKKMQALRAGWGVMLGSLLGTVLKLGASGIMAYYFLLAIT